MNFDDIFCDVLTKQPHKKILLHACCGPCAAGTLPRFSFSNVAVHFFNPNIMPFLEYEKRGEELQKVCDYFSVPLTFGSYENQAFLDFATAMKNEKENGKRCKECYYFRLKAAADYAKANGFDMLCTSLTISPHKNASDINEAGERAAKAAGVEYLPSDFKKQEGYKKSVEICKQLGIYRQNYCGCVL